MSEADKEWILVENKNSKEKESSIPRTAPVVANQKKPTKSFFSWKKLGKSLSSGMKTIKTVGTSVAKNLKTSINETVRVADIEKKKKIQKKISKQSQEQQNGTSTPLKNELRPRLFEVKQKEEEGKRFSCTIERIVLLEFDMEIGSRIIYSVSKTSKELTETQKNRIISSSLPDGSHQTSEDFQFYFLDSSNDSKEWVISYFCRKKDLRVHRNYKIKSLMISASGKHANFIFSSKGVKEVMKFSLFTYLFDLDHSDSLQFIKTKKFMSTLLNQLNSSFSSISQSLEKKEEISHSSKIISRFSLPLQTSHNEETNLEEKIMQFEFIFETNSEGEGEDEKKVETKKHFKMEIQRNEFSKEVRDPRVSISNLIRIFGMDLIYIYYSILKGNRILFLSSTLNLPTSTPKNKKKLFHDKPVSAGMLSSVCLSCSFLFTEDFIPFIIDRIDPYITIDCNLKQLHANIIAGSVNPIFENFLSSSPSETVKEEEQDESTEDQIRKKQRNDDLLVENAFKFDVICLLEQGTVKMKESRYEDLKKLIPGEEKKRFKKLMKLFTNLEKLKFNDTQSEQPMDDDWIERMMRIRFREFSEQVVSRIRKNDKKLVLTNIIDSNAEEEIEMNCFTNDWIKLYQEYMTTKNNTQLKMDKNKMEFYLNRLKSFIEHENQLITILQYIRKELISSLHGNASKKQEIITEFLTFSCFSFNLSSEFDLNGLNYLDGGLYCLAVYVFHENEVVRCLVCWILNLIVQNGGKLGQFYFDRLNPFIKHAVKENFRKFKIDENKETEETKKEEKKEEEKKEEEKEKKK